MDTGEEYGPFQQQPPSAPPSFPTTIGPAGYFPPTAPLYNAYTRVPYVSGPPPYPPTSYSQPPLTSDPFSRQTSDQDVPIGSLNLLQSAVDKVKDLSEMAEPLSVAASVLAIATAAVQVSQTLYRLADNLGSTNSEVGSIALEVETFSSVLEDLRDVLEDAEDLITPRALRNANKILSKCKEIFESIQRMLIPYKDLPQLNFWHIVQWNFRREKVKPMRCRLETLKTTLLVWLGTVKLAHYRNQSSASSTTVDRKDKKYLSNVEQSVVRNNLAVIRWQRAEAESTYLDNLYRPSHPRLTNNSLRSSQEIKWIGHLVPYATRPSNQPWNQQLLLESPEHDPSHPKAKARMEVLNTVNLLLAKWTTLNTRKKNHLATATRDTNRSFDRKTVRADAKKTAAGEEQQQKERALENDNPRSHESTSNGIKVEHSNGSPHNSPSPNRSQSARDDRPDIQHTTIPGNIIANFISRHQVDSDQEQDEQIPKQISTAPKAGENSNIGNGMDGRSRASNDERLKDNGELKDEDAHLRRQYPDYPEPPPDVSGDESDYASINIILPAEIGSQQSSPQNSQTGKMPEESITGSTPSIGATDAEFTPDLYDPHLMHPFGHGPQGGFAQTVVEPGSSASFMLPYGGMPPSQNPYPLPPFAQPYPGAGPYGAPVPVPVPAPPPAPASDTAQVAAGRDQDEALKRLEAMLMSEREERGRRAAEEAVKAEIAAKRAAVEREAEQEAALREAKKEATQAKLEVRKLEAEAAAKARHEAEAAAAKARHEAEAAAKARHEAEAAAEARHEAEAAAKARHEAEAAAKAKYEEEARYAAKEKGSIQFKDAIGRKFTFPLKLCRTWDGMEGLIRQSFQHIEGLGTQVANGHYDLLDTEGGIILPQVWETVIESGLTCTMLMWPLPGDVTKANKRNAASPPPSPEMPPPEMPPLPPDMPPLPPINAQKKVVAGSSSRPKILRKRSTNPQGSTKQKQDDYTEFYVFESPGSESNDASSSETRDFDSAAPWLEALEKSAKKLSKEFQSTWDSITEASQTKAHREILRIWLKEISASHDEDNTHENSRTPVDNAATDREFNKSIQGPHVTHLSSSNLGSGSTDTYALEALRPLLALIGSIIGKHGTTDVQAVGRPSAVGTQFCRDCQSQPPQVEPPKNRPSDLNPQLTRSPVPLAEGSAATQVLMPNLDADMSEILAQNHRLTQRLAAMEKLLQQQADEPQPTAKTARDESARPETASLPQSAQSVLLTPPVEPDTSQVDKLLKDPPKIGSNGISPSTRSSFRARLFGRAASSAGTIRRKA